MDHDCRVASLTLVCSLAFGASAFGATASAQDLAFAGSVQESYLYAFVDSPDGSDPFEGLVTEASLKVSADIDDHVSAQVKACFGCHGFELGMAFVDFHVDDALNVRIGRFSPIFGDFPIRHDPANHRTVDKPLMYDMGRMLRVVEWNEGVLPIPYTDQGIEVTGSYWFDDAVQFDYAVHAVGGLRGSNDPLDVDWIQSRILGQYYIDNNTSPAVGGRLGSAFNIGDDFSFSCGVSTMYGVYDPDETRSYLIVGTDLYARLGPVSIRAEYAMRRTEIAIGNEPANRFAYGPGPDGTYDDFFLKEGWFVNAEYQLDPAFEIVARFDGLRRLGNVAATSQLRSTSVILRYTAGVNFVLERSYRIKLFGEVYDFSDFHDDVALSVAVVVNF